MYDSGADGPPLFWFLHQRHDVHLSILHHAKYGCSVHIFERRGVVVAYRQVVARRNHIVVVDARVAYIVAKSGDEQAEYLCLREPVAHVRRAHKLETKVQHVDAVCKQWYELFRYNDWSLRANARVVLSLMRIDAPSSPTIRENS